MALVIETDTGSAANIASELAIGSFTATNNQLVAANLELSALNGAAATLTIVLRKKTSGDVLIGEPDVLARVKRTAADTVFVPRVLGPVLLNDGEKAELRVLSSNASDTSVTWAIDWLDASWASDIGGSAYALAGGRTWWVSAATGSDTNNGAFAAPRATVASAVGAAASGDTIIVLDGTHSGAVDFASKRLNLIGASRAVVITHNALSTIRNVGSGSAIRNLTINQTLATADAAIALDSTSDGVWIDNVAANGKSDGIVATDARALRITRSTITGTYDGITLGDALNFLIEDSEISTDSTYSSGTVETHAVTTNAAAGSGGNTAVGTIRRSRLAATRNDAVDNRDTIAFKGSCKVNFEDVVFQASQAGASGDGAVYGIKESATTSTSKALVLRGCTFITSSAGTGSVFDIHNSAGAVIDHGSNYSRTKVSGTQPVNTQIDAIEADTDDIGIAGAGLTDLGGMSTTMKAQVQAEAEDGLVAKGLDHLVSAAVVGADITDNSIIAKLASKSATADWDSFNNTTDALEALKDAGFSTLTQQNVTDALKLAPTAGDPAAGSVNADLDTLITRTAAAVTISEVTTVDNTVLVQNKTIYQGDDHSVAAGNALEWTTTDSATWPDLNGSGVTVTLALDIVSSNVPTGETELAEFDGATVSIVTATGATKKVRAVLTDTQSLTLTPGTHVYNYQLRATLTGGGDKRTLARGTITVIKSRVDS